jgi:hypothetical protein
MRKALILILPFLVIPGFCRGDTDPGLCLELSEITSAVYSQHRLVLDHRWPSGEVELPDLIINNRPVKVKDTSLKEFNGNLPGPEKPSPDDMISMASFVWAEIFGGVDVVAEIREFARQIKSRELSGRRTHPGRTDAPGRWKFTIAWRIDAQTELAARFDDRGNFFGRESVALVVNALDPASGEIGLSMAFGQGLLDLKADRMTLADTAEAKLQMRF